MEKQDETIICLKKFIQEIPIKINTSEKQQYQRKIFHTLCQIKNDLNSNNNELSKKNKNINQSFQSTFLDFIVLYGKYFHISEYIQFLLSDIFIQIYSHHFISLILNMLIIKGNIHFPANIRVTLLYFISKLEISEIQCYFPDLVPVSIKLLKNNDVAIRELVLTSWKRIIDTSLLYNRSKDSSNNNKKSAISIYYADITKLAAKGIVDKTPEVRKSAGELLRSIISIEGPENYPNVTFETIFNISMKIFQDPYPEIQRIASICIGDAMAWSIMNNENNNSTDNGIIDPVILNSGEIAAQYNDDNSNKSPGDNKTVNNGVPGSLIGSKLDLSILSQKAKSFKIPNMVNNISSQLPVNLARRKTQALVFNTIENALNYLRTIICPKFIFLNTSSNNNGGSIASTNSANENGNTTAGKIYGSIAIVIISLFNRLPKDYLKDKKISVTVKCILSFLDLFTDSNDLIKGRNAISYAIYKGLGLQFSEKKQTIFLASLIDLISYENTSNENNVIISNHHKVITLFTQIGQLFYSLGESSGQCYEDLEKKKVVSIYIGHEKHGVRHECSVLVGILSASFPHYRYSILGKILTNYMNVYEDAKNKKKNVSSDSADDKAQLYAIHGYSSALINILRSSVLSEIHSVPYDVYENMTDLSERMILDTIERPSSNLISNDYLLIFSRAGWGIMGTLLSTVLKEKYIKNNLERILNLWIVSSKFMTKDYSKELLRIEACVIALYNFILSWNIFLNDIMGFGQQIAEILDSISELVSTNTGVIIASSAKKVRAVLTKQRLLCWLMKCFSLLPAESYMDSNTFLVNVITEYTCGQSLTLSNDNNNSTINPVAITSFLQNKKNHDRFSSNDDHLEITSLCRIGSFPSSKNNNYSVSASCLKNSTFSDELNLILTLLYESPLSDVEVETQYLEAFWFSFKNERNPNNNNFDSLDYIRLTSSEVNSNNIGAARFSFISNHLSLFSVSSLTAVRCVDISVLLFSKIFYFLTLENQLRILQHFTACLVNNSAIIVNICSMLFAVVAEIATNISKSTSVSCGNNLSTSFHSFNSIPTDAQAKNNSNGWTEMVQSMFLTMVGHSDLALRRAVGEGLGYLSLILTDESLRLLLKELETLFTDDKNNGPNTKKNNNVTCTANLQAGCAFAFACIKRCCGIRCNDAYNYNRIYLQTGELSQPLRTWILHSWSIFLENSSTNNESAYIMNETFCPPEIDDSDTNNNNKLFGVLVAHILAGTNKYSKNLGSYWQESVVVCLGRLLNIAIAKIGPDLTTLPKTKIITFYSYWDILLSGTLFCKGNCNKAIDDVSLNLEFWKFTEQLVIFSPSHVLLEETVSMFLSLVHKYLNNNNLSNGLVGKIPDILLGTAVSVMGLLSEKFFITIKNYELQLALFIILDTIHNSKKYPLRPSFSSNLSSIFGHSFSVAKKNVNYLSDETKNTIMTLLEIDALNNATSSYARACHWILLCRGIILGNVINNSSISLVIDTPTSPDDNMFFKDLGFKTDNSKLSYEVWRVSKKVAEGLLISFPQLKWQTKLFLLECVYVILDKIGADNNDRCHFDIKEARNAVASAFMKNPTSVLTNSNYLCFYTEELITLACQASTFLSCDGQSELRAVQKKSCSLLKIIFTLFSKTIDPDHISTNNSIGQVVLNQYQAQISSAIRQLFNSSFHVHSSSKTIFCSTTSMNSEFYKTFALTVCNSIIEDEISVRRILKLVLTSIFPENIFNKKIDEKCLINKYSTFVELDKYVSLAKIFNYACETTEDSSNDEIKRSLKKDIINTFSPYLYLLYDIWLSLIKDSNLLKIKTKDNNLEFSTLTIYDDLSLVRRSFADKQIDFLLAFLNLCCRYELKDSNRQDIEFAISISFNLLYSIENRNGTGEIIRLLSCLDIAYNDKYWTILELDDPKNNFQSLGLYQDVLRMITRYTIQTNHVNMEVTAMAQNVLYRLIISFKSDNNSFLISVICDNRYNKVNDAILQTLLQCALLPISPLLETEETNLAQALIQKVLLNHLSCISFISKLILSSQNILFFNRYRPLLIDVLQMVYRLILNENDEKIYHLTLIYLQLLLKIPCDETKNDNNDKFYGLTIQILRHIHKINTDRCLKKNMNQENTAFGNFSFAVSFDNNYNDNNKSSNDVDNKIKFLYQSILLLLSHHPHSSTDRNIIHFQSIFLNYVGKLINDDSSHVIILEYAKQLCQRMIHLNMDLGKKQLKIIIPYIISLYHQVQHKADIKIETLEEGLRILILCLHITHKPNDTNDNNNNNEFLNLIIILLIRLSSYSYLNHLTAQYLLFLVNHFSIHFKKVVNDLPIHEKTKLEVILRNAMSTSFHKVNNEHTTMDQSNHTIIPQKLDFSKYK